MNKRAEKIEISNAFVNFVTDCVKDEKRKGIVAALRRADNPATEYQSWEYLAAFNIDLDKSYKRMPFLIIAAAMAKAKITENGGVGIGKALANCYDEGNKSEQAKAKLRRLLACNSIDEVCRILRPLLSFIDADKGLDFAKLLVQLLKFNFNSQSIKSHWAQDFYKYQKVAA